MSFYVGKISRNVTKNNKEFYVGRINNLPVTGSWSTKEGVEEICLFADMKQMNYLDQENEKKRAQATAGQGENKEQPV